MKTRLRKLKSRTQRTLMALPVARKWQQNKEFALERRLLNGEVVSGTDKPSVIHYSVNKAATQYTKRIMMRCGQENGLTTARFSDYAWVSSCPYLHDLSPERVKPYLHVFQPQGLLYTVFGGFVEGIPNIDEYRLVVMIRDPRDLLVSAYYSYKSSHSVPVSKDKAKAFLLLRDRISKLTIDQYAIEESEETKRRMLQYKEMGSSSANVCIIRYEDMVTDFSTWFDKLLGHCEWTISNELRQQIVAEAVKSRRVSNEDQSKHRRQMQSGDYKRKLKPETIEYLDDYLSEILTAFEYR